MEGGGGTLTGSRPIGSRTGRDLARPRGDIRRTPSRQPRRQLSGIAEDAAPHTVVTGAARPMPDEHAGTVLKAVGPSDQRQSSLTEQRG